MDITYLHADERWLYFAIARVACFLHLLDGAMESQQPTELFERALRMARALRRVVPVDFEFHADRDTQYTSSQAHEVCAQLGGRSAGRGVEGALGQRDDRVILVNTADRAR